MDSIALIAFALITKVESVGKGILTIVLARYCLLCILKRLLFKKTITIWQFEFCRRNFSAQLLANVDIRSFMSVKSVNVVSKLLVVAIARLFLICSISILEIPSKSFLSFH